MKKIILAIVTLIATQAFGTGVCPDGEGWKKLDIQPGKTEYVWTCGTGAVIGQLLTPEKMLLTPAGCKIEASCVKAGSINQSLGTESGPTSGCVAPVEIVHSSGKELSHVSLKLGPCPKPTPTPPPPTPTPTPPPPCTRPDDPEPQCTESTCGQMLSWIVGCKDYIKNCPSCACVPETQCLGKCGLVSDGCGKTIDCGTCPIPTPAPDCTTCEFPTRYMAETGGFFLERLYLPEGGVAKTIIVEGTQAKVYELVYWTGTPPNGEDRKNALVHRFTGPGSVTIPVPPAGLPLPPGSYVEVYGGKSRVTVWFQNDPKVEVQHFNRVWTFVR